MDDFRPNIVINCTSRKRFRASRALQAESLADGTLADVAAEWRLRLRIATPQARARDLYAGRGFCEALAAQSKSGGALHMVSAGLGFIDSDRRVPSYDLTLSTASRHAIARRVTDGTFAPSEWWTRLHEARSSLAPIADQISRNTDGIWLLALSSSYLDLVANDVLSLDPNNLSRLRIATRATQLRGSTAQLAPYTLPYDDRLDGPDSPLPGTRSDFAQRAARHFLEHVFPGAPSADLREHKTRVGECLKDWRLPPKHARRRCTDDELIFLIIESWTQAEGRSARMLRVLRDEKGVACEQRRFADLFKQAARLRSAT